VSARITDAEIRAMAPMGQRVRIVRPVERFPFAFVDGGEGTIIWNNNESICVTLDDHYSGLAEWHNALVWFEETIVEFLQDVEFIPCEVCNHVAAGHTCCP
jgi:hypothetical protein